jgi:hypothetical protein
MRHHWSPRLVVFACLVGGFGCGGEATGDSGLSIEGTWDGGAIPSPGVFLNVTFTLADTDGDLTGQGFISVPGFACDVAVTGTRTGENFVITMNCPGFQPWGYRGVATASLLDGKFNGSGFTNFQFTMAKE